MPKTILVIDDDDGVRDIIQFGLVAAAGWGVLTAASGQEGIIQAVTYQPDAILLDVMMPNLDGATTFRQLQANEKTRHIPTILLTAKASISEYQPLLELGVKGWIAKPFKAKTLAAQIQAILKWD
ncbi:response regulator [Phormidesmis sp. 146-35]